MLRNGAVHMTMYIGNLFPAIGLIIEYGKFGLRPSRTTATDDRHFSEFLFSKIERQQVRTSWRSFYLHYLIISALNRRDYAVAFRAFRGFGKELRWETMPIPCLRTVFEAAIISDDLDVSAIVLEALSKKQGLSASERANLHDLIDWRSGRLSDESQLNLESRRFVEFPEYDHYFKGRIHASLLHVVEARAQFEASLRIAPEDAIDLRLDIARRLKELPRVTSVPPVSQL